MPGGRLREDEIKTMLEKERALRWERGKPVLRLIPLNLDEYMFTAQWHLGVLAKEIRGRVAADFRDWQDDDAKFNDKVGPLSFRAEQMAQYVAGCNRILVYRKWPFSIQGFTRRSLHMLFTIIPYEYYERHRVPRYGS